MHGVLTCRRSKGVSGKDGRISGVGWQSGGKIHNFTVVPGLCPLGTFREGDLGLDVYTDLKLF